jgi:hypothetical protein
LSTLVVSEQSRVEQLYWAILGVRRIRAGAQVALAGAEEAVKTGLVEAKIALVEA